MNDMMILKSECLILIRAAIESVNPKRLITSNLRCVQDQKYLFANKLELNLDRKVYVAAFGKAVLEMCVAVNELLGNHIHKGIAILPVGLNSDSLLNSKFQVYKGAKNNLPDNESQVAANEIYEMCKSLTNKDLLITLISGGGSALLSLPVDNISLEDKIKTTKLLASSGASINELNLVRMCLSKLKGGGLARCAYPAQIVSFIVSDVIGDPLEIISSGPTILSSNSTNKFEDALNIIEKFKLADKCPDSVIEFLNEEKFKFLSNKDEETKLNASLKGSINNFLIGSNKIALEALKSKAAELNVHAVFILTNALSGEARAVGKIFAYLNFVLLNINQYETNFDEFQRFLTCKLSTDEIKILNEFLEIILKDKATFKSFKKYCILTGGETTVNLFDCKNLPNDCIGGRNQELTLSFKLNMHLLSNINLTWLLNNNLNSSKIVFTSFGTDGIDGPTDAAGAIVSSPFKDINQNDLTNMQVCLEQHNSYKYFENKDELIKIGHTGTNVSDLQILLIDNSL